MVHPPKKASTSVNSAIYKKIAAFCTLCYSVSSRSQQQNKTQIRKRKKNHRTKIIEAYYQVLRKLTFPYRVFSSYIPVHRNFPWTLSTDMTCTISRCSESAVLLNTRKDSEHKISTSTLEVSSLIYWFTGEHSTGNAWFLHTRIQGFKLVSREQHNPLSP